MLGGGGGCVIVYLIELGIKKGDMLMVNLMFIVLCVLLGKIFYSYCDLILVVSMIVDYGVFVVCNDLLFKIW